jgi:hypothetical protein
MSLASFNPKLLVPMIIRPAFPDEHLRIRSFCQGAALPENAHYLVAISKTPVERIKAAFPYWPPHGQNDSQTTFEFALHFGPSLADPEALLTNVLVTLEKHAAAAGATHLRSQASYPEDHPIFSKLTSHGYIIAQTDRHFTMPADAVISRSKRVYDKIKHRIPAHWKVESIRGHNPEDIYRIVSEHHLMSAHQFKNYWDSSNHEHFEQDYSCVIVDGDEIIATFLHTLRGNDELHIHVDAITPRHKHLSGLATVAMRNWIASNFSNGSPHILTSRADSKIHTEGGNTPLRHKDGTELTPTHFLSKFLTPNS